MAIIASYVKIIQLKLKQTMFVDGFLITIFLKTLSDCVYVCPPIWWWYDTHKAWTFVK